MIRKMLMVAAAVAMPLGIVAATAGTASAATVTDATGAPATANCTSSGGSLTFKYGIGLAGGSYVFPTKNKGNQISVTGVTLTCTSPAVTGSFTGAVSGKIKTSNPTETPAQAYACTGLSGVDPAPGGTVTGSLKVKWSAPTGQKFGGGSKSTIAVTSILGGTSGGFGTFTVPGNPGTGSIVGSFPGSDGGASGTTTSTTAQSEAALAGQCLAAGGLTTISLGSGTASLQ